MHVVMMIMVMVVVGMVVQAPVDVHAPAMLMPLLPGAAAATAAVRCCAGLVCSITITTVQCPLLPAACCCLPDLLNGLCITGPEAVHNLDVNTVIIHLVHLQDRPLHVANALWGHRQCCNSI